ncbi:class I SAM-dependent methyltransferase [Streptomyces sp. DSM 44915]|uniref:Class I SAM-dependent methyltransferase n=1 Tax=Streptomyces chisholmiae TaxID=3075540 RepID=A0ABU2JVR7_9ACTN|nr:class I SAM-dependent methyltransferase [Streptomyces sp. DSM 44915]MDT0269030.1 class I SAM-dependent methyltransferase [Streptomyces sp. DSM 44915]
MTDPYAASAPFIDPLIAGFWREAGPSLTAALARLAPGGGPVVDLGAGSGRGTRIAAAALPAARIVAVEPSAAMRTALLARLMDDPALAERVTVVADEALGFAFPEETRAVLALNMLGHLAPDDRRALWALVADRLAPDGLVLVNNPPPTSAEAVPRTAGPTVRVGDHAYRGWSEAEPAGRQSLVWHMTYETLDAERVVSRVTVDYGWWVVGEAELRAEWASVGLAVRSVEAGGVHVLGRAAES